MSASEVRLRVGPATELLDLVFAWVYRICANEYGVTGHGGAASGWHVDLASGNSVNVVPHGNRTIVFRTDDALVAGRVPQIAAEAVKRAREKDTLGRRSGGQRAWRPLLLVA